MADTGKCFALVRGRAMRVTKLDGCGAVVLGPDSEVSSEGFISVAFTANTDEGTAISVTNAAGKVCISDTPAPKFTGYGIEVQFCGVNPDLIAMMTGQSKVLDGDDLAVGFRMNSGVDAADSGFAIELWSSVPAAVCEEGATDTYGYLLVPFVQGGVLGDFSIENDAVNFTLTGAQSKDGSAWGVGPYDVVLDGDAEASPLLVAIDTKDHLHMQLTAVAPPDTEDCGTGPVGVPATLITAGIPATLTPANSYPPATLATLISEAPTKTPTTAWTTGQRVVLRDGSSAHWNSTTWIAGPA